MFNLKAANHQIIGTRETYRTEASRKGGIASVKANAPDAKATIRPDDARFSDRAE